MRRLPFVSALAAGAAVLALVAGVLLLEGSSTAQDLELDGVSAAELEARGIILEPPRAGDLPAVDAARAASAAKEEHRPDARAREVQLARLGGDVGSSMKAGQLVWVVNVDPETIEPPAPGGWRGPIETKADGSPDYGELKYSLIFVNAMTGKYTNGLSSSELPEYMR